MFKKIALVAILLFATSYVYVYADFTTFPTSGGYGYNNSYNNNSSYYGSDSDSSATDTSYSDDAGGSYPKITQMEKKLYNRSYDGTDIYGRLQRLEKTLYKQTYDDVDLSDRVDKIAGELKISPMPGYLINDIAALEKANFDKVFSKDTPDNRLDRLEYHLIGAIQEGNFENRVYKLKSLTTQNGISHYLDSANSDMTGIEPQNTTATAHKFSGTIQNILYFVAPLLFGLL
jgi:hypothetical protein